MMALGPGITVWPKPGGAGDRGAWVLYSKRGTTIGFIVWYTPWKRYAFFPQEQTVLSEEHLEAIKGFVAEHNADLAIAALGEPV